MRWAQSTDARWHRPDPVTAPTPAGHTACPTESSELRDRPPLPPINPLICSPPTPHLTGKGESTNFTVLGAPGRRSLRSSTSPSGSVPNPQNGPGRHTACLLFDPGYLSPNWLVRGQMRVGQMDRRPAASAAHRGHTRDSKTPTRTEASSLTQAFSHQRPSANTHLPMSTWGSEAFSGGR